MVREHYVAVLSVNHVSVFYMVSREHSHVLLSDHGSLSQKSM